MLGWFFEVLARKCGYEREISDDKVVWVCKHIKSYTPEEAQVLKAVVSVFCCTARRIQSFNNTVADDFQGFSSSEEEDLADVEGGEPVGEAAEQEEPKVTARRQAALSSQLVEPLMPHRFFDQMEIKHFHRLPPT